MAVARSRNGVFTMTEELKKALAAAIEEKFLPSTPFLDKAEGAVVLESIAEDHAIVRFGEKVLKVHFKEELGVFTIGAAHRVSAVKKDQAADGAPPMTNVEEREESAELVANADAKREDLTSRGKRTASGNLAAAGAAAGGPTETGDRVAENPAVVKPAGNPAIAGKAVDVKKDGIEDEEAIEEQIAPGIHALAAQVAAAMAEEDPEKIAGKTAGAGQVEKKRASDPSLEDLSAQFEALAKSLKALGGTDMANAEQLEKARRSVAGHLANIQKALAAHKAAHDRLHKAHEQMLDAHKAVHEMHKAAHDARQVHKAAHDAFHSAAADGLQEIGKVLGGGPESFSEFGAPDSIEVSAKPDGSSAYPTPPIAGKALTADDLQKAVDAAVAKALKAAEVKPAEVKPAEPKSAEAAPAQVEKVDVQEQIRKGVIEGMKQIFDAVAAEGEAPGVGSRSARRPFSKAEDSGSEQEVGAIEMTAQDWEAYRRGEKKAVQKAQARTSTKWQEVPARILQRRQAN